MKNTCPLRIAHCQSVRGVTSCYLRTSYSSVLMESLSDLESCVGMMARTLAFRLLAFSLLSIFLCCVVLYCGKMWRQRITTLVWRFLSEAFDITSVTWIVTSIRGSISFKYVSLDATAVPKIRICMAATQWWRKTWGRILRRTPTSTGNDLISDDISSALSDIFGDLPLDRLQIWQMELISMQVEKNTSMIGSRRCPITRS